MSAVVTTMSSTSIKFAWTQPNSNGDSITSYKLELFNKLVGLFQEIQSLCNPGLTLNCTVPMTNFTNQLGYTPGNLIIARVSAKNSIGYGTPSPNNTIGVVA